MSASPDAFRAENGGEEDQQNVEGRRILTELIASRVVVVHNTVFPTPFHMATAVAKFGFHRPVQFINLLKFRKHAKYADGSHANWSGAEAYTKYAKEVKERLLPVIGATITLAGVCRGLMIGEVTDLWDAVAIIRYKSLASCAELTGSPIFLDVHRHRLAAVEGEINIMVWETENFALFDNKLGDAPTSAAAALASVFAGASSVDQTSSGSKTKPEKEDAEAALNGASSSKPVRGFALL